jgi:hypothetical protein
MQGCNRIFATLSKAKKRQDNPDNDHQAHQIDQSVHGMLLSILQAFNERV